MRSCTSAVGTLSSIAACFSRSGFFVRLVCE